MEKSKKGLYIFIIVLMCICIFACSFLIFYFNKHREGIVKLDSINVDRKISLTKNVKFVDNDYFDFNSESSEYITKLLDKIEVGFGYNTTFSNMVKGKYSYYVKGVLKNKDNTLNSTLYKGEKKQFEIEGNVININDTFTIDVIDYINKYNEVKNKYDIKDEAYIEYRVYVDYDVYNKEVKNNKTNTDELFIRIPISRKKTSIVKSRNVDDSYKFYAKFTNTDRKLFYVICLEILCAIILFALVILFVYKKMISEIGIYDRKLKNIFDLYERQIVHLSGIPNLSEYNILFVKSFDDIVDSSNKLKVPINYVNIVDHKECVFIVFNDNNAYVYKFNEIIIKKESD